MKLVEFKEVTTISVYFKNGMAQTFELEEGDKETEGNGWIYIEYKSGRESEEINRAEIAFLRRFKRKVPVRDEDPATTQPSPEASVSGGDLL